MGDCCCQLYFHHNTATLYKHYITKFESYYSTLQVNTIIGRLVPLGLGPNFTRVDLSTTPNRRIVQPRLEQLLLSPDFVITDKPTTRVYDFVVSMEEGAPDGFYRKMLVVNGELNPVVSSILHGGC